MPKNIEDITPPKKEPSAFFLELSKAKANAVGGKTETVYRSVPARMKKQSEPSPVHVSEEDMLPPTPPRVTTHVHFLSRRRVWVSALVAVIGLGVVLSFLFAGATVAITPKVLDFALQSTFSASKDSASNLSFQVMSITDTSTVEVPKSGTATTASKATGTVILYNGTAAKQSLLINTRLTRPDGKIYFTDKALTIPASTSIAGTLTPGSIEVSITAEKTGEEYNSDPTDFKILGFKGSSKYESIYGRSKTPISGGASQPENTITAAEASIAYEQAKGTLRTKLLDKARAQIPADYVLYDDGAFITTDPANPNILSATDEIPVTASGTLSAIMFSRSLLTKAILEQKTKTPIDEKEALITNLDSLTFALVNKQLIDPLTTNAISFTLAGTPHALWLVDEAAVKTALLGKDKKDVSTILESFPGIEYAHVVIRPFWNMKLPAATEKIKININEVAPKPIDANG